MWQTKRTTENVPDSAAKAIADGRWIEITLPRGKLQLQEIFHSDRSNLDRPSCFNVPWPLPQYCKKRSTPFAAIMA
jgi:hypothetical protein